MRKDGLERGIIALRRMWRGLSLGQQFLLAGGPILIGGMFTIGFWVTNQIEDSVTRNAAITTALYVDSVIAPIMPELRSAEILPEGPRRALDEILSQGALGKRLVSFKIWREGGRILYATESSQIGMTYPPSESLRTAWQGSVAAEFDELADAENVFERASGKPLLEIYSPIREPWSGQVQAVAEFYEVANELQRNLRHAQSNSWLVVAAVTLAMIGLLFGIVLKGDRLIASQRSALEDRVAQLSKLLEQNRELRIRVQEASRRATGLNESFLRRISADLHDGPAQLLALAALRMGSGGMIDGRADDGARRKEVVAIRSCLDEAMQEIRDICQGLALPQLESTSPHELIVTVVSAHEQRTGGNVLLEVSEGLPDIGVAEKICVYRFIQEALNNAYRHAGGAVQTVSADFCDGVFLISVSDRGPGFDPEAVPPGRLGLAGLRERVESIGGNFRIETSPRGSRLTLCLNVEERPWQ